MRIMSDNVSFTADDKQWFLWNEWKIEEMKDYMISLISKEGYRADKSIIRSMFDQLILIFDERLSLLQKLFVWIFHERNQLAFKETNEVTPFIKGFWSALLTAE